jgi:hypothetical protein
VAVASRAGPQLTPTTGDGPGFRLDSSFYIPLKPGLDHR